MPSIQRPLSGDVLVFQLNEERARTEDPVATARRGPSARTLLKEGPLRVTLVVLGPGGSIAEHSADGPITVQPIEGALRFTAAGTHYDIEPGELLSTRGGVRHAVSSESGATFLLTVAQPDTGDRNREA